MFTSPLPQAFYNRSTLTVAKDLLGKYLIRETASGIMAAKIVDVEAYVGPEDKACHASKGRTKRTEVLFGPPGFTYVYLIYGMYDLLNFVTERPEFPAAILIRGVEIVEQDTKTLSQAIRIDGPGRVCRRLSIDRTLNRIDATTGQQIWVEDRGDKIARKQVQTAARIGVEYAGEWAKKPWRFYLPPTQGPVKSRTPSQRTNPPRIRRSS